jgi:tetratricopeptide (TPR) repeat protein
MLAIVNRVAAAHLAAGEQVDEAAVRHRPRFRRHHRAQTGDAGSGAAARTPAEHRRANLAAATSAMLKDAATSALKSFSEMLRLDPDDLEAQYGFGRVSLDLEHYREAAAAFERVIPRLREQRSPVYDEAAYAYLALGDAARAEAILTARYGVEEGRRHMIELRAAVRKR